MIVSLIIIFIALNGHAIAQSSSDWYRHAVVYQIYPRTFKDTNNDGIGDLKGITSKLDHLKDINVDALWMSPIYPSPQVDGGYDISDYTGIAEEYGTLDDFDELVTKATELGIKVILDLVPNHSSNEHDWFVKSIEGVEPYKDYYVWKDSRGVDEMEEPTNWYAVFGGKAWTYNETRQQWYLGQFTPQQPDLNFDNPAVMDAIKNVMKFWLDRGVYGFRIDAVDHLYEEFLDEPPLSDCGTADKWEDFDHIHTRLQEKNFEAIYEWRKFVDDYTKDNGGETRILMSESCPEMKTAWKCYHNVDKTKLGAHFPFNFHLVGNLNNNTDARDIVNLVNAWFSFMPTGFTPNWVLGNHDNHRLASRIGPELVNSMNMLVAVLPGVMVSYNGEEIGMEDGEVSFVDGKDPHGCHVGENGFAQVSRDFERTPFHWDNTTNAGFNEGEKPWLPVSEKYKTNNLAQQKDEAERDPTVGNHYQNYKALTNLRRTSRALKDGTWELHSIDRDGILGFRKYPDERTVVYIIHMGRTENDFTVNLGEYGFDSSGEFDVVAANLPGAIGTKLSIDDNKITMKKFEGYVLLDSSAGYNKMSLALILGIVLRFLF